ncbi:AGAP002790-PA-like protein [Anopheles sinensis]|uniref:AGAP002790-PA-like protein n=1 Tax=Anopheles sinensis TaxID=74873 RepID=A0A084VGB6_ANOSI|nr:AGAP002790-PA-like protein [Anopheles sinensis]
MWCGMKAAGKKGKRQSEKRAMDATEQCNFALRNGHIRFIVLSTSAEARKSGPAGTMSRRRFWVEESVSRVYPGRDITNIVESSHYQKIGGWCRQGALNAAKCKGAQRWIKPFRCLGKCMFVCKGVPNGSEDPTDWKIANSFFSSLLPDQAASSAAHCQSVGAGWSAKIAKPTRLGHIKA